MTTGRIGVDLGGTKIEAIALVEGEIAVRERVATPQGDYDETIAAIAGLVDQVARAAGLDPEAPVGVGTPGSVDRHTGLHRNSNSTCLNGRPFEAELAAAVGRPLRSANDANCFALSEAADGGATRGAGRGRGAGARRGGVSRARDRRRGGGSARRRRADPGQLREAGATIRSSDTDAPLHLESRRCSIDPR